MGWNAIRYSTLAACIAGGVAGMLVLGVWAGDSAPPAPAPETKKAEELAKDTGAKESAFVRATRNATRAGDAPVPVITNTELAKIPGNAPPAASAQPPGSPAAAPAKGEGGEESALAQLESERKTAAERDQLVLVAERDLAAAKKRLEDLEVQLLAVKNPFARRPELSDEEKTVRAETQESGAERLARTQKLVDEARAEVGAAEARLAAARAGG